MIRNNKKYTIKRLTYNPKRVIIYTRERGKPLEGGETMRKLRYKKGEWLATRDGENKTFASSLEALEWLLK